MLGSQWGIVRTTKKSTYYLSNEHNDDLTKIAWTKRKDKARRFETKNDAVRTLSTRTTSFSASFQTGYTSSPINSWIFVLERSNEP